ncbi:UNVERIFIED_CONTAM: putative mitochondrial protein [Sesamum radiatum]|uniref:Mitochondrial protein n=1 Tax=Sesamum radiatum TaxID=300843 RepID=A0AAW2V7T3_SESRA
MGDLRKKATFLAEAERHFYYQKAKIHFLKQGDRNTKFFHDMVKWNAARNSILAITKADGSIITSVLDIAQEFVDFYTSLLGTEDQTRPVDDGVFHWGLSLTLELASNLCRAVTPAEVKTAVFQISDNKAPGPDGYTSCFLRKTWNIVGDRVCRAVMDFFRSGRMLRQLNHTIIALVPKSEHSPSVADYLPISCGNVIYKVITKIIADRLSPALEQFIDRSQAAFIGGRNITDNIFLAQEMVLQYSRKRISPRCTINVDLRKAFDLVSWTFLSRVLHGYGFPPLFISWIMECVSTTSFSVALNDSLHGLFPGQKGLRQGDPMSPALFLLCMEYFSRLIKRNTSNSDSNFHLKCEKLKITHLLFADDLTLFSRGDLPSIHILMECLQEFRDVSGLAVNTTKSNIFTAGIQDDILDGILAMTEFARVFPLPMAVIEKIHRLCRVFLWNSKRAPVAWEEICHPKEEGGLGIRHIKSWNVALLAGVLWNIYREADTFWAKWVNEVYLRGALPWDWQPKKGDSPLLRRLAEIQDRIIIDFGSTEAAIQHIAEWTDSKGLVTSKAYDYFKPKLPRQP